MDGIYAIIAFVVGWFVAQSAKLIVGIIEGKKIGKKADLATLIGYVFRSGGMPSGHTASFSALCIYIGCVMGFDSVVFALALCTLIIVIYDATHVRYAVGEQGKALNELLHQAGKPELALVEGHTVFQVLVGMVIGILSGLVVFWVSKGGF